MTIHVASGDALAHHSTLLRLAYDSDDAVARGSLRGIPVAPVRLLRRGIGECIKSRSTLRLYEGCMKALDSVPLGIILLAVLPGEALAPTLGFHEALRWHKRHLAEP